MSTFSEILTNKIASAILSQKKETRAMKNVFKHSAKILILLLFLSLLITITSCKTEEDMLKKSTKSNEMEKEERVIPEKFAKDIVVIHTNFGDIKLELFRDTAPISVENFLTYAKEKFYDGLIFHRIISTFMIQCGGFDQNYQRKSVTHPPIKNEAGNGLSNMRGTIAMARTNQINSATSQFFINVVDNLSLDHRDEGAGFGYAVFGKVIDGMDVVDKIKNVPTGINQTTGMRDCPKENVVIESVEIVGEVGK